MCMSHWESGSVAPLKKLIEMLIDFDCLVLEFDTSKDLARWLSE